MKAHPPLFFKISSTWINTSGWVICKTHTWSFSDLCAVEKGHICDIYVQTHSGGIRHVDVDVTGFEGKAREAGAVQAKRTLYMRKRKIPYLRLKKDIELIDMHEGSHFAYRWVVYIWCPPCGAPLHASAESLPLRCRAPLPPPARRSLAPSAGREKDEEAPVAHSPPVSPAKRHNTVNHTVRMYN